MATSKSIPGVLEDTVKGEFAIRSAKGSRWTTVLFQPSKELAPNGDEEDEEHAEAESGFELLKVNPSLKRLVFTPRRLHSGSYSKRYAHIHTMELEGFVFEKPTTPEDVFGLLESLPVGFTRDPDFGLGLRKELCHIVVAVEDIQGINHLVISKKRPTSINGNTFVLKIAEFDQLRRAMNACHKQALKGAAEDKRNLAFNTLVHPLNPARYPERSRLQNERTIYRVLEASAKSKLSDKNQIAAVGVVTSNSAELAEHHPDVLMQLHRQIDLVNLDQLITRVGALIGKHGGESQWQRFFAANPFILSLAFGFPAVLFQQQVSVGGGKFSGVGQKIGDFIVTNVLTNNLALVEIKTPDTKLLGHTYRSGVYPPTQELSGAITQILDQRYRIQAELTQLKENSRQYNLERFSVECVVIVGTMPADVEQRKCFEMFRGALHGVSVIRSGSTGARHPTRRPGASVQPADRDRRAYEP
jgi:hypothetical protein